MAIDWMPVTGWGNKQIGAVGFVGNEAVLIVSYFSDADGNKDGKVSTGEWLASKVSPVRLDGYAIAQVAKQAAVDMDIVMRDANIANIANQLFLKFAARSVMDGLYAAYFKRPVGVGAGALASAVGGGMVKSFAIKKGAEAAVQHAFRATY